MRYPIWCYGDRSSFLQHCWTSAAMYARKKRSHWVILSSMFLRSFTAITDSNSITKLRARASLRSPCLACPDGNGFIATFKSEVTKTAPALWWVETLPLFVSPRVVGAGKLPDIAGRGITRELVVWPRSMFFCFCSTTGDHWNGDAVSVITDRIRQHDFTQNA